MKIRLYIDEDAMDEDLIYALRYQTRGVKNVKVDVRVKVKK